MSSQLSPKQVARALGVSESSLKRWCDQGLIQATKTSGGHRRLATESVLDYLRKSGQALANPELLNLPVRAGNGPRTLERAQEDLLAAALAGDEACCQQILLDLHVAGIPLSRVSDEVIAKVFRLIGEQWECGETEVYCERRAVQACARAIYSLRQSLPPIATTAPVAIGGTAACDPYTLPTNLVELVLRQCGWVAHSLGSGLPFSTFARAIVDLRPRLFWLSVSHLECEAKFLDEYGAFYETVSPRVCVVVGGRALHEELRQQMKYGSYCDTLQHLEAFVGAAFPLRGKRRRGSN